MSPPDAQTSSPAVPPGAGSLVVLFDGHCGLCDASVNFILRHDARQRFRFAPLQSTIAADLMRQHGLDPVKTDSVVLVDGDHAYTQSTAVLKIAVELDSPWPLAAVLSLVPKSLRDDAYEFVSRHRHQFFKRRDTCRMPTEAERDRFIG